MIGIMKIDNTTDHVEFFVNRVEELEQLKGGTFNGQIIGHGSTALVRDTKEVFIYDAENDEWISL